MAFSSLAKRSSQDDAVFLVADGCIRKPEDAVDTPEKTAPFCVVTKMTASHMECHLRRFALRRSTCGFILFLIRHRADSQDILTFACPASPMVDAFSGWNFIHLDVLAVHDADGEQGKYDIFIHSLDKLCTLRRLFILCEYLWGDLFVDALKIRPRNDVSIVCERLIEVGKMLFLMEDAKLLIGVNEILRRQKVVLPFPSPINNLQDILRCGNERRDVTEGTILRPHFHIRESEFLFDVILQTPIKP